MGRPKKVVADEAALPKVGIAITSRNRNDQLAQTLVNIRKVTPAAFLIVVVDDASSTPVDGATFRFEQNAGIAAAKNKCFELLADAGCDHFFLFDDDCWPVVDNWWQPYTQSPEPHLAYIFPEYPDGSDRRLNDTVEIDRDEKHVAWSHQRGCLLYYKRIVLDTVGGMDWHYGVWGHEHGSLADRIFNAGLTTHRYMDVLNSNTLFHSMDEHLQIDSTCSTSVRTQQISQNAEYYRQQRNSAAYIDYRRADLPVGSLNVVITSFFTGQPDPERKAHWQADYDLLDKLIDSIKPGVKLVILHDCFDEAVDSHFIEHVRVPAITTSPYFARWIYARQYLSRHPEIAKVWCVDATDVIMVNNPFPDMQPGALYTGDEPTITANSWMLANHPAKWLQDYMKGHAADILLNAGLLGGERGTVLRFLSYLVGLWEDNKKDQAYGKSASVGDSDMGLFNYVARQHYKPVLQHGRRVNTVFKRYQCTQNVRSWWRHK